MRLIDLSQPLYDQCPNCPAHELVRSTAIADHPKEGWRLEALALTPHAGSHLDAPLHKIAGGKSIDQIPLDSFVTDAFVADLRPLQPGTPIGPELLAAKLPERINDCAVLLCTGWGERRARTQEWLHQAPFLSRSGAEWLTQKGIRGVGIDHYSIGGAIEPENGRIHEILLGNEVWILEELRFPAEALAPRPSKLWALPVNLKGHSGAFCRPVLAVE